MTPDPQTDMAGNTVFRISRSKYDAVIFDLDGVVTKTAKVHAAAWKKLFDEYLKQRAAREGGDFQPFDIRTDYTRHVDGKPRYEGVRDFLRSRGIELPYGTPDDNPDKETICGLGNRKNKLFRERLATEGAEVYTPTIDLIKGLKSRGFKTAIVSSSKNCSDVLDAAEIAGLFDAQVDGIVSAELNLEGKPAPDIFLEAARRLRVSPERAIVVEDAISGVEAGKNGQFGFVVGVDRADQAEALKEAGANAIVTRLSQISVEEREAAADVEGSLPSALAHREEIWRRMKDQTVVVFLDYDGTLTPIVSTPEQAVLSESMRETVLELSSHCIVSVVSGRDLRDVQKLVAIDTIFYAGSHGFDIAGPKGRHMEYQQGTEALPTLDRIERELREKLKGIAGVLVERKKFSIAVHYRNVDDSKVGSVERVVDKLLEGQSEIRKSSGKKVFDLQPNIDWHKGKAILWLIEALDLERDKIVPLYIGDDTTDEDAFRTLKGWGIGIVVMRNRRPTQADYMVSDPDEVQAFLTALTSMIGGKN